MSNVPTPENALAIIGLGGRFPGADDVAQFWRNVRAGACSITHFSDAELEDAFSAEARANANFVRARAILHDVDQFDADFFSMRAREAALTDPQHRLLMECAWAALEDAGYEPTAYGGAIGVFAGSSFNTYLLNNLCAERDALQRFCSDYQVGSYELLLGALGDTLATRLSYKLDLKGPAMTVQSACSTSLLAIAQACQSLLFYQCDMALAGGVSITFPQKRGYLYQPGGMVSPDGVCRPFDADAGGTVFGDGAAIVLLKRLEDALSDRDHIYAIVRGWGVNNDGASKVGFTAPSVSGQAATIAMAQAAAGVTPDSIGYIECHGTATPLGDPIEFAGLIEAFGESAASGWCALGSAKANIGHLDAAAGAAGLIKAAFALHHREIPPLANFSRPNPRIDLGASPFYVPREALSWRRGAAPRRAGVSSFGVGGTNVHVVLEEAPEQKRPQRRGGGVEIVALSAANAQALSAMRARLADHLERNQESDLGDIAHTLQSGRRACAARVAFACRDVDEAINQLRDTKVQPASAQANPRVVFLFPGQGAQWSGMGGVLYQSQRLFRDVIDEGADLLHPLIGEDIRTSILGEAIDRERINATRLAQPALFLVEYAIARLVIEWGVKPDAMAGHSVGEFVAAAISGVLSFGDALGFVARRGEILDAQPPGAMIAVRASEAEARALAGDDVDVAALNSPRLSVLSGSFEAMANVEMRLNRAKRSFRRLHTSHAFHSRMMDGAIAALDAAAAELTPCPPQIPYVSCVTGERQTAEALASPRYWALHCRNSVRFQSVLETLGQDGESIFLEVGPGNALTTFTAQTLARDRIGAAITTLGERDGPDAHAAMGEALAKLWCAGKAPDWTKLRGAAIRRQSLPGYCFQRKRHWVDAIAAPVAPAAPEPRPEPLSTHERSPMSEAPSAAVLSALEHQIIAIVEDLSGEPLAMRAKGATFLEMGFDSLFLGQVAVQIKSKLKVAITFRQLLGELATIEALACHLHACVPTSNAGVAAITKAPALQCATPTGYQVFAPGNAPGDAPTDVQGLGELAAIMQLQLKAMQEVIDKQLQIVSAPRATLASIAARTPPSAPPRAESPHHESGARSRPYLPGSTGPDLTHAQRSLVNTLVTKTNALMPGSKAYAQDHRAVLADPRTAAGFNPAWKELVFPIVCARSKGSRIWDIDGNEYIDLVNGYGQTAFGHAPDFVCDALNEQISKGFAIGPQSALAGEVAKLISALTGAERVTFCNTGSEAVMAAMRVARAASGRKRVVVFNHDYHGQFDEVLVKGARSSAKALPIASGIPSESVANMTVLSYGADDSLAWIEANAAELAAVIVEPVQSRHPDLQPMAFLRALRAITEKVGVALVFDEVVTGFRVHQGGAQAAFDIRADLATYGKVLGGGMPIGVLAGKAELMDVLDGGQWSYGDASAPEIAPTFFAGTFVRHPLVLAAAKATLDHIVTQGPNLQSELAAKTQTLVATINADLERRGLTSRAKTFSSWFHLNLAAEDNLASLFYPLARSLGLHVQEGYPCFLTTAHSDRDIASIASVFANCLDGLQEAGILRPACQTSARPPSPAPEGSPREAPLTEPQVEIFLAAQSSDAASCAFNESVSVQLAGPLNVAALELALGEVIARHDALRAYLAPAARALAVRETSPPQLTILDLSASDAANEQLAEYIAVDARTPFDLFEGPLVRLALVQTGAHAHTLLLSAHHIICDGWSINVVLNELAALYSAHLAGARPVLAPTLSFARFAQEAQARQSSNTSITEHWRNVLSDIPPLPDLPLDRTRPAARTFGGDTYTAFIDADLFRQFKSVSAREGGTLFAGLFSAFQVLIGRLANHRDVIIAAPFAGQALVEGDAVLVGHCVNLLPLRAPFAAAARFSDHLRLVQQRLLDALDHQDTTFGTLVRDLSPPRATGRLPLTELQFNLERPVEDKGFAGLQSKVTPNGKAFSNFDLFLNVVESSDGLRLDCDFNADIFDRSTIARWIDCYRRLIETFANNPDERIDAVSLMTRDERLWLTSTLNDTGEDFPREAALCDLIALQAAKTPDAIAVTDEDGDLSYGGLEALADRLAERLCKLAPTPGGRIGVAAGRSRRMLAALLAIAKAGHAYIPLDPHHPPARLRQILDDAQPSAFICDDPALAAIAPNSATVLRIDLEDFNIPNDEAPRTRPFWPAVRAEDPAYLIYTSGSTGAPKGVEVSHRALVNLLTSMAKRPGFGASDVMMAVTTLSFDIAALELFLPLITGGSVIIASRDEVRSGVLLADHVRRARPTMMQATPTLWRLLLEAGFVAYPTLKMLCGGEPLARDLADALLEGGGELWNMYGPTETTIWSAAAKVAPNAPITIGAPIANTQIHILDDADSLVPIGVAGHLCIGGEGLAIGYYNNPELTARAFNFVSIDTGAPRRLYRTGDLARRRPDGQIQVLGRNDTQIKLRGFRIELEEIEAVLRRAPGLRDCAVGVCGIGGDRRLVGYVVSQPGAHLEPDRLFCHVSANLPDYMTPSHWVALERLPLTGNLKLDRNALPAPDASSRAPQARIVAAPRNGLETQLSQICAAVLGAGEVSVHDNLFALGADSLHIFRIAQRLHDIDIAIAAKHIFEHPTIAALAAFIETNGAPERAEANPALPSLRDFRGGARRRKHGP